LFWPRGAAALLRNDLANAFARSADYVAATMRELAMAGPASETTRTARAADAALHRLDDMFRQYLVERSATRIMVEDAAALVSGAARVRRAAQSLVALERMRDGSAGLDVCGRHIEAELNTLHAWYVDFGDALVHQRVVPPPHLRDGDGRRELFQCASAAARDGDKASKQAALILLLAVQHLDNLRRLEAHLGERANAARPTGRGQTATRPSSTGIEAPFR
jgi:hypothetical protein